VGRKPNLGMFQRLIAVAWATKKPIVVVLKHRLSDHWIEVNGPIGGQLIDNRVTLHLTIPSYDEGFSLSIPVLEAKNELVLVETTIPPSDTPADPDATPPRPAAPGVGLLLSEDMLNYYYAWQYLRKITKWPVTRGWQGRTNLDITTPVGPIGEDMEVVTVVNVGRILKFLIGKLSAEQYKNLTSVSFSLEQNFVTGITAADDAIHYGIETDNNSAVYATSYRADPGKSEFNTALDLTGAKQISQTVETFDKVFSGPGGGGNPRRTRLRNLYGTMRYTVNKTTGALSYSAGA
jgi:hypothetical protein